MDLPLSGSNEALLLEIETPLFNFYIKNDSKRKQSNKLNEEDRALFKINCKEACKVSLYGLDMEEIHHLYQMTEPQFFEQTPYQIVIENKSAKRISFDHDSMLIRNKVTPLGKTGMILSGVINFESEIGMTQLRVLVDGVPYLIVELEVYPTKLSYKSDYLKLREDIALEIYNLAFDFMKKTYTPAALVYKERPSLTEFFSILRQQFETFIQSIELIIRNPHHKLEQHEEVRRYVNGQQMGPKGVNYLNRHPQQLMKLNGKIVPKKVSVSYKVITMDTYENQMVRHMILQIIARLRHVTKLYKKLGREEDGKVIELIQGFVHQLERCIRTSFLKDVSSLKKVVQFSLVMQMSPVYRKFYKIYLILQKGLSISADIFNISNKNVAELYEYWCFIKLGTLIRKKHHMIGTDFIKGNQQGLYVSLRKGNASTMRFRNYITGEVFSLTYNQKLQQGPTVAQKPDNILTLKKEMEDVEYRYILDAKYKLDYETIKGEVIEVPREEDINTMHRYRDAIVSKHKTSCYQNSIFGAMILFPGSQNEAYKESRFYQSIQKVNIGGLPFLPSNTAWVEDFLDHLIERTGHMEYDHLPVAVGFKEYMEDLNIREKDVLVGPLKNSQQLMSCLAHNIYHVPRKRIKDYNHTFKYVALYEHKEMNTLQTGGIRYLGEVESVRLVQRKDLLDLFPTEHTNLEEEYLVYKVRGWKLHKETILPNGYGVRTPWYTNHTLLKYAKTLPELHIKDEAEFKLLLQLRRMVNELETSLSTQNELMIKYGQISIYMNKQKQIVLSTSKGEKVFSAGDLSHAPRRVYKYIGEELA